MGFLRQEGPQGLGGGKEVVSFGAEGKNDGIGEPKNTFGHYLQGSKTLLGRGKGD